MIAGLIMHMCRSGNGNILLLCSAGGINGLRCNRRLEENRRKTAGHKLCVCDSPAPLDGSKNASQFIQYNISGLLATTISPPLSGTAQHLRYCFNEHLLKQWMLQ